MTFDINEIERAMLAEHRERLAEHEKNMEALARLKRFFPVNGISYGEASGGTGGQSKAAPQNAVSAIPPDGDVKSLRARVAEIMASNPENRWSAQTMLAELLRTGFSTAAKNPLPSVQIAMARWVSMGKAETVRKGTGRIANLYRWKNSEVPTDKMEGAM